MTSIKNHAQHAFHIFVPVAIAAACSAGGGGEKKEFANGGSSGSSGSNTGGTGAIQVGGNDAGVITPTCSSNCTDFPAGPILDQGVPPNAAELFGPVDPSKFTGAPCVLEPQLSSGATPGALFPANWLRPRFRFTAPGADLFEIRISSPVQANTLVAYTKSTTWYLPAEIWKAAAPNNGNKPMTVTIRALSSASPATHSGIQGDINIAPVAAGGSMVFWTVKDSNVTPESSKLYGFSVGEEGVTEVLTTKGSTNGLDFTGIIHELGVDPRAEYCANNPSAEGCKPGFAPGDVQCIGCHTSTPDGEAVIITDDWPWNKAIASVKPESAGQVPAYVSPGARALLKMPWLGTQTMSPAFWAPGNRILVTTYGARGAQPFSSGGPCKAGQVTCSGEADRLIWINLETPEAISDQIPQQTSGMRQQASDQRNAAITAAQGKAWDFIATSGEAGNAVTPDWNNAGDSIVYVSTDDSPDGHPDYAATRADLMTVPYNAAKGGSAAPLPGASDPGLLEYYPAFSADGKFIAFTRAPGKNSTAGCPAPPCTDGPYYNRFGEIMIVPSAGGTPTRLVANEAIACAGDNPIKGLLNSWPKWSPTVRTTDGKSYYFLIFSSARAYPGLFDIPRGKYTPTTLDTRSSQLYMAAIVVDDASGQITTYPSIYLWNQNRAAVNGTAVDIQNSNLTPAWDEFVIPPVDIPPPR